MISPLRTAVSLVIVAALGGALALAGESALRPVPTPRVVTLHHGHVTSEYVDLGAPGPSVGDVWVLTAALTDDSGAALGWLRGTVTTTAENQPGPGDEIRNVDLVLQAGGAGDQIVIGGQAAYPKDGGTLASGSVTIRPITGGSGAYAGARGWVETRHFANDTWDQVAHLLP